MTGRRFHVKAKTEWKRMPENIFKDYLFADVMDGGRGSYVDANGNEVIPGIKFPDAFDGIDELDDYELVKEDIAADDGDDDDDDNASKKSKKRKRQTERPNSEERQPVDGEHDDDEDEDGDKSEYREPSKKKKISKAVADLSSSKKSKELPAKKSKQKKRNTSKQQIKERKRGPAYDSMQLTSTSTTTAKRSFADGKDDDEKSNNMYAWYQFAVPDPILRALADLGYDHPTEIQARCIPDAIRDRKDILGAAETGSGKTLAFGIPIITHILADKEEEAKEGSAELTEDNVGDKPETSTAKRNTKLRCLIVTPTRELAVQIKNHLVAIAKYTDIKITVIVGGMSQEKQFRILKRCPEIVVGTPGRIWEMVTEGKNHLAKAPSVKYFVIDEADRMQERGHFMELSSLLAYLNYDETKKAARQTFVFSATLTLVHDAPKWIATSKKRRQMTEKIKLDNLMDAIGIKENRKIVDITKKAGTVDTLQEGRINCSLEDKDAYLYYILTQHPGRSLVFCNSVDCVRRLTTVMTMLKRSPWPLHANMHQKQRLKNLERFTAIENAVLVATDVAQRGLDIPNVQHVIHYQVPRTTEAYVHRSGRTARASKEGVSIMLIDPDEIIDYHRICRNLNRENELPVFPVNLSVMRQVRQVVKLAQVLDQKEHRFKRLNSQNNWFKQAAEAADIELDEDELLEEMGDKSEIASFKRQMKSMRQQLDAMLRKPILSQTVNARFPSFGANLSSLLAKATSSGKDSALTIIKKEKRVTNESPRKSIKLGTNFNKSKAKIKSKRKKKKKRKN